jgi:two-component system LytT family sensor kinase
MTLPGTSHSPPRRTPWRIILVAWAGYGLLIAAQYYVSSSMRGQPAGWRMALLLQAPQAVLWAMFTPVILWLCRRFPLERGQWPRSIAVHALVSVSFVFLLDILYTWHVSNVIPAWEGMRPFWTRVTTLFVVWIASDGMLYWMVVALQYAAERQRRLRERELSASQLETQLVQADLQALKMQLHPHFLFNALNTIGSLVRTGDRDNAVSVVAGLGDLLRRVLDGASQQEVPLKQELDFVRSYLAIEQARYRDRLKVAISVDDGALDARVPHLILQPLVENAIRHGIGPHLAAGRLTIGVRRIGDRLHLLVRDDGPGIGATNGSGTEPRPGIGLSNTRARLQRLYGDDFGLEVCNAVDGGLEARIELPFQLAAAEWAGER